MSQAADGAHLIAWTHGRGAWVIPPTAILTVSPTSLSFSVGEGGAQPGSQTLTVSNRGATPLSWTATPNATWVTVTPAADPALPAGASGQVSVSISSAALVAGTYAATIAFTSNGGSANVGVTLVIPRFPGKYQSLRPARIL